MILSIAGERAKPRTRLLLARFTVVGAGFGSAGMLVAVLFGLVVWLAAKHGRVEIAAPYLASLAAALLGYLLGSVRWRTAPG